MKHNATIAEKAKFKIDCVPVHDENKSWTWILGEWRDGEYSVHCSGRSYSEESGKTSARILRDQIIDGREL